MSTQHTKTVFLMAAFALSGGAAAAEELGKAEYDLLCSECHGMLGKGDGPAAELLINGAPDLTQLSSNNGGKFPLDFVVEVIDGRSGLRGHDGKLMPLFGRFFYGTFADTMRLGQRPEEPENTGGFFDPEIYALGQELALAYYVQSLQE